MIFTFGFLPRTIAENKEVDSLITALNKKGFFVKCPNCRNSCSYFNYDGYALRCSSCRKEVGRCRCAKTHAEPPPYSTHIERDQWEANLMPVCIEDIQVADCTDFVCSQWNANTCDCYGTCGCHWKESKQWNPF